MNKTYFIRALFFALFLAVFLLDSSTILPGSIPAAVILNGILGGGNNKVGGVIMSKWKGIPYIRAYARPSNPNSESQQTVRSKHSVLSKLTASIMGTLIPAVWDKIAVQMSGFNYFYKSNYDTLDANNKLQASSVISKGSLEPTSSLSCTYNSSNGIFTFAWSDTIYGNGLLTDLLIAMIYDKNQGKFLYYEAGNNTRNGAPLDATIATGLTATNLIGFIAFYRGTGSEFVCSNSVGDIAAAA